MALVQNHGTGGLHPETPDPTHEPPSHRLRLQSPGQASRPAPAQRRRRRAATPRVVPLNPLRGNVLAPRGTKSLHVIDPRSGVPTEIKYYGVAGHLAAPIRTLCRVHLCDEPPDAFFQDLHVHTLISKMQELRPTASEIWRVEPGRAQAQVAPVPDLDEHHLLPFPLHFLVRQHQLYLIHSLISEQKCEFCGRYYKQTHTCSVRRRDFYFHHVQAHSSHWWQEIKFFPLGAHPDTRRLFVTYDVETYTSINRFGKQLMPFMLVMHIGGDEQMAAEAQQLARDQGWQVWRSLTHPRVFYLLTPQPKAIGCRFKEFRDSLQQHFARQLWRLFKLENFQLLHDLAAKEGLSSPDDLQPEHFKSLKFQGRPRFWEIYIIGHNISGFDEIVMAAQVVNHRGEIPPPFRVTRNFMPRCGKILFNDITFALPNPQYSKEGGTDYALWEQGGCGDADFKCQSLKFMVRDTFALTHTSLRKAAQAYELSVEKGCCPYQAVNEFYMKGTYRTDSDGFPDEGYWKDSEEYRLNKELWLQSKKTHDERYDLVKQTLDYCALDVLVTAELVLRLQDSYARFVHESVNLPLCAFNIFQRPTISSNSHAIFRQVVYRAERPQKPHLGSVLLAPSHELYDYVRASIRGGRCYPTFIGVLEEPLYVYDICGMYASALTHPFPAGAPLNPYERALALHAWQQRLDRRDTPLDYFDPDLLPGIFTIDADPPPEDMLDVLPPFCSRKGGRLCWTNESLRGEVATSIDVMTLHNRGWRVRLQPDERATVFPEWRCVAREYVQLNIAAKERADRDKNQTLRSIAKLLSNALYGSFATKLDNKKTVFSDQMEGALVKGVASGHYSIKSSSFIETDNLSSEYMDAWAAEFLPGQLALQEPTVVAGSGSDPEEDNEDPPEHAPFYTPPQPTPGDPDHVTYTYKPITFLDCDEDALCLHTLEKNDPLIENERYPSHIASFVLAWTRAFVSEWAGFLYDEDRGTPLHLRPLKSVYGDTDSLFVTERGHRLMETRGKHRIKKNGGGLVFDPQHPQLTWLVECETQCSKCGADAYSPESVFLAPKLYALKSLRCPQCGHEGKGKLRAKGHPASELSYQLLLNCYLEEYQGGNARYETSRLTLKRSLASVQAQAHPFTVTETTLRRTLRPWKDRTLAPLTPGEMHRLRPYSNSHPNPRNQETCWIEMP
ncbi:pol [Titi monkey adenovirus ECC-2011]|uniref:DNA polymerase n=1 Tax=titi monkey adenovirus 1 TaxID=3123084 RepID=G0ZAH6_9ADEN|nr:pol [Titi monkey adenovirus ECC-2011]AEK98447.1 pol [Titi monkey adenovirus ECC-2011]